MNRPIFDGIQYDYGKIFFIFFCPFLVMFLFLSFLLTMYHDATQCLMLILETESLSVSCPIIGLVSMVFESLVLAVQSSFAILEIIAISQ